MGIVDFILNLAGLLIWLNWRSNRVDPMIKRLPATLMGTLRPTATRNLTPLASAGHYHGIAAVARADLLVALPQNAGKVNLGLVVIWFNGHAHANSHWIPWIEFSHMVFFSFFSFGLLLGIFLLWLLILSLLAGPMPIHGLVTIPLGRVDGWPRWAKIILPFLVTASLWALIGWGLGWLQILPPISLAGRLEQSVVLGLYSYLQWAYPLEAILILYLLNSYIYFGKHPAWKYINVTAQTLLRPLRQLPLQAGRVDFAPLVGMTLIFLAAYFVEHGYTSPVHYDEYKHPLPVSIHLPGLQEIYRKLPF